jgi:hypothetical protein
MLSYALVKLENSELPMKLQEFERRGHAFGVRNREKR